jgi:alpha-tubulin suppressor-like RCC1 family protein
LSPSAGSNHTCGVTYVGGLVLILTTYYWGDNSSGQLGNGTTTNSATPMPIPGSSGILSPAVSAGTLYSCGLGSNTAYCWGHNSAGQLGNGTVISSSVPVVVSGGLDFAGVSTGAHHACGPAHTFANGIAFSYAYCWGDNSFGQLGNGTTTTNATPVVVAGGLNFTTVSAGGRHTCGVTSSGLNSSPTAGGAAYCWGDNTLGQLGNSWTASSSVPVNVTGQP